MSDLSVSTPVRDDRKTLMMPVYEADAYEMALNTVIDEMDLTHRAYANLVRLRDRINSARVGHWGRR